MSATHSLDGTGHLKQASFARRYGYSLVTAGLFVVSLGLHWWLGWRAYVQESEAHGQPVQVSEYLTETGRDTFENWQSEFLQLLWQVAGLAFLLHVGSPASSEGDERLEAKLDAVLRAVSREDAERILKDLDERYDRT